MIEIQNVSRRFGSTDALVDVSLSMPEGSFTSLLGPSGCGKSTLLRIIAGLDRPTSGTILVNGRNVADHSPSERNIAMVFQSYALYPHMTVRQNITLPLAMRNLNRIERLPLLGFLLPDARRKRAENAGKVSRITKMLEIDALLDRKPSELSGGQKQRVAVGRALVRDPVAFLLDEPLSNLDAKLRTQMRGEIVDLHKRTGRTFIYVTHDQAEAMSMSDRIAVFREGRVLQTATPRDLYERPVSRDVAAFIGDRPINLTDLRTATNRLPPPFDGFAVTGDRLPENLTVGLRPEALRLVPDGLLRGRVETVEYLGSDAVIGVRLAGDVMIRAEIDTAADLPGYGDAVALGFDVGRAYLFDGDTGMRLDAALTPLATAPTRQAVGSPG